MFAAADGRANDAGLLASLAAAQENSNRLLKDYSIVVVAVEEIFGFRENSFISIPHTPCGDVVKAFCIAAPGTYRYLDKESGADNENYDATDNLATAKSANAAASLVAGGLAVLESLFGSQLSSKELVARLLKTASQSFDMNNDGKNDYLDAKAGLTKEQRYGVGLMDLECASRPLTILAKGSEGSCRKIPERDALCQQAGGTIRGNVCLPAGVAITIFNIETEAKAKTLFTGDTSLVFPSSSQIKRVAREYQNQSALAQVNAADAYVRGFTTTTRSTNQLNLGQGARISVITNKRFDPTHPEFASSASGASYQTLTRFNVFGGSIIKDASSLSNTYAAFFAGDTDGAIEFYRRGFGSGYGDLTLAIPELAGRHFDTVSRNQFDQAGLASLRTALFEVFRSLIGGTRFTGSSMPNIYPLGGSYYIDFSGSGHRTGLAGLISLTELPSSAEHRNYQHVGRLYSLLSNIASHQIVVDSSAVVQNDGGTAHNDVASLALATDADMGVLALINGLLDPARSDSTAELNANTHGIAPYARLDVLTSLKAGDAHFNGADLIYRARGIDFGRDRRNGNLIADDARNIVLIQNTIAHASRTEVCQSGKY